MSIKGVGIIFSNNSNNKIKLYFDKQLLGNFKPYYFENSNELYLIGLTRNSLYVERLENLKIDFCKFLPKLKYYINRIYYEDCGFVKVYCFDQLIGEYFNVLDENDFIIYKIQLNEVYESYS